MPWKPEDAHRHTHDVPEGGGRSARQWRDIANKVLEDTGDEGRAIREANGIIRKGHAGVGGVPPGPNPREPLTEGDGV